MTDIIINFGKHYPSRFTWIRLFDVIKQRRKQGLLNYGKKEKV